MLARELAQAVAEGASVEAEVWASYQKICSNPYNAFLHQDDAALQPYIGTQLQQLQTRLASGEKPPLAGVPLVLKDNLADAGQRLGCASKILEGYRAPYTATVVSRLKKAGAIVVGRSNMDEFAMGSSTENSAYGPAQNPLNPSLAPGGSSGGSAVAVASGVAPLSLGSETGGSVRQPASFCGIVGFKPSYGRVSRYGLVAFASSLDCVAPFGRDVRDTARVLACMAGHDPQDATSVAAPVGELESACDRSIQGLKIGYLEEEAGVEPGVTGAIRKAADVLKEAGAELLPVRIPSLKKALACYCVLAPAEASANLARFEGVRYGFRATGTDYAGLYPKTRGQGFGREVQRRILLGTFALSSGYSDKFYLKAQEVRKEITTALYSALQNVDLLLGPTSPTTAFPLGARTADPLSMYLADLFTIPASLAGLPAISVPAGCSEGLPVGAQLTGRYLEEATVFSAAAVLEAAKL